MRFNPRARGGRDLNFIAFYPLPKSVSIHAPAGGATRALLFIQKSHTCFNPRARGGRDPRYIYDESNLQRFNPRARGGRDSQAIIQALRRIVSIHAPAGGATDILGEPSNSLDVSIHAPAGGATYWFFGFDCAHYWFQSTRPRGARHFAFDSNLPNDSVSIHAPAGGATRYRV